MGNNISYTLCSLFFSIMLIIVFFSKKRLQSVENKIYSWLIITNFFGLIIQISCGVFTPMTSGSISSMFFTKMYFIYLLTWLFLFVFYTFFVSKKDNNNNIFCYPNPQPFHTTAPSCPTSPIFPAHLHIRKLKNPLY